MSDLCSYVFSSDLGPGIERGRFVTRRVQGIGQALGDCAQVGGATEGHVAVEHRAHGGSRRWPREGGGVGFAADRGRCRRRGSCLRFAANGVGHRRSEEHTSERQSLMRSSYAVFCLKKKKEMKRNKEK